MPIIETVDHIEPISQGDILSGIQLYISGDCWEESGGQARATKQKYCMVVSRPCVAIHKPQLIVAAIEKYKVTLSDDVKEFDELVQVYTEIRDGTGQPDQLYLGQIPGNAGSFCARLDLLHTIQVPPQSRMTEFLRNRRIGRLSSDFARDLHVRIFSAFSRLGFSDHSWFSDADLRHVLAVGDERLKQLESELQGEMVRKAKGEAQGFAHASQQEANKRKINEIQSKIEKVKIMLSPYKQESEKRLTADRDLS